MTELPPPPPVPPSPAVPLPPTAAEFLFGARLPLAVRYAELLATDGVVRGLLGPRETPRLWDRHLLNCAAIQELIYPSATVIDVGSGAGLPGIVLAVARPDISVILVEPLARRTAFLDEVVPELGLSDQVSVVRARAEELAGQYLADHVVARAVAPLERLANWCLPLTAVGGRMLALKGASAPAELAEHQGAVTRLGGGKGVIRRCGADIVDPPAIVVEVVRERPVPDPLAPDRRQGDRAGMSRGKSGRRRR